MGGDFYATNHPRRGIALVICNQTFLPQTKLPPRDGAPSDLQNLQLTFANLGFEVRTFRNLTAQEMLKNARLVTKDRLEECDYLVVAISTHGSTRLVPSGENYGMDGVDFVEEIDLLYGTDAPIDVEDLVKTFSESDCPGLKGKPKLFFFQGCRGVQLAETVRVKLPAGTPVQNDASTATDNTDSQAEDMSDMIDARVYKPANSDLASPSTLFTPMDTTTTSLSQEESSRRVDVPDLTVPQVVQHVVQPMEVDVAGNKPGSAGEAPPYAIQEGETASTDSLLGPQRPRDRPVPEIREREKIVSKKVIISRDFLTMWSCPPGYYAFHRKSGSPFITHLCDVLRRLHEEDDLLSLLTEVNRLVATQYECKHREKQFKGRHIVPSIEHMLRKGVCLHTKTTGSCPKCPAD